MKTNATAEICSITSAPAPKTVYTSAIASNSPLIPWI